MPTDTFTNANGTALPTHNSLWVTPTGSVALSIQSNTAYGTAAGFSTNYWNATFASAHYSKGVIDPTRSSVICGVAIRIQATGLSHYYAILFTDEKVYAGQSVAGVFTDWDTGQTGFVAGDEMELSIDPVVTTTVYLKRNGSTVATYTSKSALTGGRPGVCAFGSVVGPGLTSWDGGDVVATDDVVIRSRLNAGLNPRLNSGLG